MKSIIYTLCIVMALESCYTYHAYTKKEVIRIAKKNDVKRNGKVIIDEEQRKVSLLTRDSNFQQVDVIFEFDNNGKQLKYSVVAACDSCLLKYLQKEIKKKFFKWTMLNDSTYVSKYGFKQMLHIHKATYSYDIVKHNLSKKQYIDLISITPKSD